METELEQDSAARAQEDIGFLRRVLEAVPAVVILIDAQYRIAYINHVNPGFTMEMVIGQPASLFIEPEYRQRQRAAIDAALRTGQPQQFLARGRGVEQESGFYDSRVMAVSFGNGERAVCVIAIEISEQLAQAAALHESEEKLRLLVEATGIGLWSWDVASGKAEWSPRMSEIVGTEPLALPQYVAQAVHPDDRERVAAVMARADPTPGSEYPTHRIVRPDGSTRWVMPRGTAYRDDEGNLVRVLGGTLDVTEQHQLQEHVRNSQKIEAIGALTAGVAHNFNNMLAVIVPALDLVLRDARDTQRKLLIDAAHAARRASELVGQLMTFAGQKREDGRKRQDIAPIIERAVSMCRRTFASQAAIELAPIGEHDPVYCDASMIEQVVVNLLINARDALVLARKDAACVRVEVTEATTVAPSALQGTAPRGYLRIAIADEGVGMTREVKQHLFEPFFTTKAPGRGTGLGLATSYGIVRDHDGFIMFDSKEGVGTTAAVYLPVDPTAAGSTSEVAAQVADGKCGTVLIIDDEAAVRSVVEEVLRIHGHKAISAADAGALASIAKTDVAPDLVLLDRSMPGFPIRAALSELRRRWPDVPILFFTGQDVPQEERALVQGVLYKPLSLDDLVAAVESWLPPKQGA